MEIIKIENTPMWNEVQKIQSSGPKDVFFYWTGTLHTVDNDFDVMKVITVDIVRDYVLKIGDEVNIEFEMTMGEYVKWFYPYRNNCEMTLYQKPVQEVSTQQKTNTPIGFERYKVVFLEDENPAVKGTKYDRVDKTTLDLTGLITVKLQLLNRSLEPLRIKETGGSYAGTGYKDIMHSVLGGESSKVLVDGKPAVDSVDIVKPDNSDVKKHIIIPPGTLMTAVPTFLHHRMGGVYTAGIGTFFQTYAKRRTWFVYPLYNVERFSENYPKVIFYAIPEERYYGIERTFRVAGDVLHVLCIDNKKYKDDGETGLMKSGVGFRMADARSFMKKPVQMTPEGPRGVRSQLNHEVSAFNRADNLNYAPVAKEEISSNPFIEYGDILHRKGARMDFAWHNSLPDLLYPGMPARFMYLSGDTVKHIDGSIIGTHSVVQLDGTGLVASRHKTSTAVSLFVDQTKA